MTLRTLPLLALSLFLLPGCAGAQERGGPTGARTDLPLESIRLPPGFSISVYAADVPNARSLTLSPAGVLYVGSREGDKVHAVVDTDGDQVADRVHVVDEGLRAPNGVAWRDGSLYVAEVSRILRYDDIDDRLENPPDPVVIRDDYPTERSHGWKFIRFDPDQEWLYVPVGAPCNICLSEDPIFATITRIRPDGSEREIVAEGVRNSVGFDWNPATRVLWFTDNGRDRMGDDVPPDELNRVPELGRHYGYPFCHGGDIPDPEYGDRRPCSEFVPPARKLGPHVAALGIRFYDGEMFPAEYRGDLFIAEHGSWNRSEKIGYRVMRVGIENDEAVSYEPFAEGWLQGEDDWGRPVDVLVMPDGALLVSDDENGVVYRIAYAGGE
ncbi:MAG TPA: sorbosone dehydrogenase family protein [Gemmatimonadota bacterium]|nr:sorbosone dehydrogenase family protein [Gemmatimonadota bacterium]